MELEEKRVICKVCCTQYARYICPRCNLAYCCLACYKQHSQACTEAFYRDQATHELHNTRADAKTKRELLAMLQRVQQQQAEDESMQQAFLTGQTQRHTGHERLLAQGGPQHDTYNEHNYSLQEDLPDTESDDSSTSELDSNPDSDTDGDGDPSEANSDSRQDRAATQLSRKTMRRLLKKLQETSLNSLTIDESDLDPEELAAFQRALAAGELSHLLPLWEPWWLTPEARDVTLSSTGQSIIQELQPQQPTSDRKRSDGAQHTSIESGDRTANGSERDTNLTTARVLPAGPSKPLQPLSSLTKAKPSPLLKWQLLELLYVYCYIQRRFNGEAASDENVLEAAQLALHISPALFTLPSTPKKPLAASSYVNSKPAAPTKNIDTNEGMLKQISSPEPTSTNTMKEGTADSQQATSLSASASDALLQCVESVCRPPVGDMSCRAMSVGILGDVFAVLSCGMPATILALSDLQQILETAMEQQQQQNKKLSSTSNGAVKRGSQSRKQLFAAVNKLWFFMCWLNDLPDTAVAEYELAPAVQSIWHDHMATMNHRNSSLLGSPKHVEPPRTSL